MEGHRALAEAEQTGCYSGPIVWAHGAGRRKIARACLGRTELCGSRSPAAIPPIRSWSPLRACPAIVVVDRETSRIVGVRFHNRRRP
jgi:hypothetical protein